MLRLIVFAAACLVAVALPAAAHAQDRYALANGCYGLKSQALGALAGKTADGGYRAGAATPERFRMQATDLGSYLLYGAARDFLAHGTKAAAPGLPLPLPVPAGTTQRIQAEASPSAAADWRVEPAGGAFTLALATRCSRRATAASWCSRTARGPATARCSPSSPRRAAPTIPRPRRTSRATRRAARPHTGRSQACSTRTCT
jgi:hypothetical protein